VSSAAQHHPLGQPSAGAADGSLSASFPAVAESLASIRNAAASFALQGDAPPDTVDAIRLVCSEAAANVVEHAYINSPGEIHLRAVRNSEAVWIVVADDGQGLVPRPDKRSAGVGFGWMATFSDAMTLEPAFGGGLEMVFRFRLADGPQSESAVHSASGVR